MRSLNCQERFHQETRRSMQAYLSALRSPPATSAPLHEATAASPPSAERPRMATSQGASSDDSTRQALDFPRHCLA